MVARPAKLLAQYEAGVLTRHELLIRLGQAAADWAPADLAAELPADILVEVREWSASPPDSPERCRVFHAGGFTGNAEYWERYFREESRRLYDGLWRWHGYFADAE
jgi:hypothetical protein